MKKFLIVFCLILGTLFVHAEKSFFVGLSNGTDVRSAFRSSYSFNIALGQEIENSYEAYLGFVSVGVGLSAWFGSFDMSYGYSFLRAGNWSLGIEASALFRTIQYLAFGGKIGLYTRLKLSESFDLGFQIGVLNLRAFSEETEKVELMSTYEGIVGYAYVGFRYYFF